MAERNGPRPQFRAQLVGGPLSGGTVELFSFEPTIRVYQNGGMPFGIAAESDPPGDVEGFGEYDMVGPLGPETPTYVIRCS